MATAKATRQAAPAPALAYRNTHTTAWDTDGMPALVVTEVESSSIPGLWYTVRYRVAEETAQCQCVAAFHNQRCKHGDLAGREGRAVVAQHRAAVACELADHWRDEFAADARYCAACSGTRNVG